MTSTDARAQLLHETVEHHGAFEAVAPPHDWWDWYAAYMLAREAGSTSEDASAAADRYMAEVKHVVVPRAKPWRSQPVSSPSHYRRWQRVSPQYWRVAFDHAPINTLTAEMVAELSELVDAIERDEDLNVVVFTSRNPEFFLAHYDTEGDPAEDRVDASRPDRHAPVARPTARLSRAPVVSIASIRGRARGAGSEFVLACDIRLAGDEDGPWRSSRSARRRPRWRPDGSPAATDGPRPRTRGAARRRRHRRCAGGALRLRQPRRARPRARAGDRAPRAPPRVLRQARHRRDQGLRRRDHPARRRGAAARFAPSSPRRAARDPARLAALAAHGLGRDSELERRLGELVTLAGGS